MCHHSSLITVCFACLLISAHTSGLEDENGKKHSVCDTHQLFEQHSENGVLSLQSYDKIMEIMNGENCHITTDQKGKTQHPYPEDHPDHDHHKHPDHDHEEHDHDDHSGVDSENHHDHNHSTDQTEESAGFNSWLYASLSVLFISGCGFIAVAIIKILPKWLEQPAIQFLVALAVGTLMGDAVLHLIPHAYVPYHHNHESHPKNSSDSTDDHDSHLMSDHGHDTTVVWKGVVVLVCSFSFFLIERLLNILGEWRQRIQSEKQADKVAQLLSGTSKMVGDKLCQHRQHSHTGHQHEVVELEKADHHFSASSKDHQINPAITSPPDTEARCEITKDSKECSTVPENGGCSEWTGLLVGEPLIYCATHEICDGSDATVESKRIPIADSEHIVSVNIKPKVNSAGESISSAAVAPDERVFISEHHTSHHGHSHSHGHIHARPEGFASLAWLVLAGDGLHNLSDGLAIGGAFAASITGGFTTALAVLFHELPHELGDFAVLLKAGMTIKQALICNLISSVLCLFGVLIGLTIGTSYDIAPWIFACTAGMFLYIALVDMMPELNGTMKNHSALLQLSLQLAGLVTGVSIMLLIALYEHEFGRLLQS